jgi:hypothetical protein
MESQIPPGVASLMLPRAVMPMMLIFDTMLAAAVWSGSSYSEIRTC